VASVFYFYIYKDAAAQWRWRFTAKTGKTIAVSSESYNNLVDCAHAVSLIKTESASSPVIGDENYDRLRE
jgi:hypothetical protein